MSCSCKTDYLQKNVMYFSVVKLNIKAYIKPIIQHKSENITKAVGTISVFLPNSTLYLP